MFPLVRAAACGRQQLRQEDARHAGSITEFDGESSRQMNRSGRTGSRACHASNSLLAFFTVKPQGLSMKRLTAVLTLVVICSTGLPPRHRPSVAPVLGKPLEYGGRCRAGKYRPGPGPTLRCRGVRHSRMIFVFQPSSSNSSAGLIPPDVLHSRRGMALTPNPLVVAAACPHVALWLLRR